MFDMAESDYNLYMILFCIPDKLLSKFRFYSLQCKFTSRCKQVVNRLKIPQGLSTLSFRRWSEVPLRGGVRGDSLKKNDLSYKDVIVCVTASGWVNSLVKKAQEPPGSLHTLVSSVE